jgi:cytochrome b6-f complex iron-sulfur subunit
MADEKKRLSVAEMLAAARKGDANRATGGGASEPAEPAAASEAAAPEAAAPEAIAPPEIAESPAEISEATVPEVVAPEAPAIKPAAPKAAAAPKKPGERLSVAEMMAAARVAKTAQGAAGPKADAPAASKPAAPKAAPARAPAAAKAAPAKAAASKAAATKPAAPGSAAPGSAAPGSAAQPKAAPAEPKQSASILAAARGEKPGPMSKAVAATKPQPSRESVAAAKAKLAVPPMPTKPEYAKAPVAKGKAKGEAVERRGMLVLALGSMLGLGFTSLSVTLGLWTLGGTRFMFPNVLNEPPSTFKVGPKDAFSPGQVATQFVAKYAAWVCNYEYKGVKEIYALKTVCTHLGCTPNWLEGEQKFKCPCHGSGYYKDGINFEGPAPRPLERYAIRVADDGQLEIDKSKTFHEELGQWTDPASFVPA